MHQIQHVGTPALAGALAAQQLLPNPPQFVPLQQAVAAQVPVPAAAAVGAGVVGVGAAVAVQQPQGQAPVQGGHRVFKLQFDARWIICCSQDCRIVGWDYAAEEEGIVEASRFFVGG